MASLTSLPPELRAVIYTYLLEDGLASGKRIVYCHDDDQYDDLEFSPVNQHSEDQDDIQPESEPVGWIRSAMQYTTNHQARITSLIDVRYTYGPDVLKRAIHHADIEDLLALASTCRRMRTEILPMAWSNADITIYTPDNHFKNDVFHIFDRCLSRDTCAFISNIHIDVGTNRWSASAVSETSNFIMKRLPHQKELHMSIARESTTTDLPELDYGLRALTCLPCRIMVEVDAYIHPTTVSQEPFDRVLINLFGNGTQHMVYQRKEWEQAISLNDMFFFEMARHETQFARALRVQNEERHIDGSLLEDTLGLRSCMAGWPVFATHTTPKERWEVRVEGCWCNGFKVKEGVEATIEDERDYSLGPWFDKIKCRQDASKTEGE